MITVRTFDNLLNIAVATSASLLGFSDDDCQVGLFVNDIAISPDLLTGDLVEATFGGYARISPTAGSQVQIFDPPTGRMGVALKEPVGGFNWLVSTVPDPEETVYGWFLIGSGSDLWALEKFDAPIPILAALQQINVVRTFGFLPVPAYGDLGT